jgi:hypothetical protein
MSDAQLPRRSSRLQVKEERKAAGGSLNVKQTKQVYWNASSTSGSDDGEGVEELIAVVNTPSRSSKITPQKPNNFTKV